MKLVSIFFTASGSIFEIYLKYSEKIFQKEKIPLAKSTAPTLKIQ